MGKYLFALTFIFHVLLVFAKSADILNSAIKFAWEINNDKVTNKEIFNIDQVTFKTESINNFAGSEEYDLLKENEYLEETKEQNISNSSQTNTTNKHTSHYEIDNSFIESHNDRNIVMEVKLNINSVANVPMKQQQKGASAKNVSKVCLEKNLSDFKTVNSNAVLKSNQTVQLIVTMVPEEYNNNGFLEKEIIKIFPSLYSLLIGKTNNISKDTSTKTKTTTIKKSNIEKNSVTFNDAAIKTTTSTFLIRDYKDNNNKSVIFEKVVNEVNGVSQTSNYSFKNGTQARKQNENNNEFEIDFSKTVPSNAILKPLIPVITKKFKTSQVNYPADKILSNNSLNGYFLKKRNILSYEKDDEKNLANDLQNRNKINFLNDIKPDQININEPRGHHVYKRVKKDLSRLFLHEQNDKDNDEINFSFLKLPMPLVLLPSFKPEDLDANKKSINIEKINKRSNTNEKYNPVPNMAVQSSLMDYLLNSLLFGQLLTASEQYKEPDTQFIVNTLLSNGDKFFLDNEVFMEPKYHRLTNNHDINKKHHKHKRRYFSKQRSTTVASSTNNDFVELFLNKDAESVAITTFIDIFNDETVNDNEKKELLKIKRSFTIDEAPHPLNNNSLEVILTEKSPERYQQPQYKICRIKRNGLLSSTIPSVICLMLSLGFLWYFLHKRKYLYKRRCIWFVVPDETEIRERVFEPNTKKENQTKTDDEAKTKTLYKNDNFQIA